MAYCGVNIMLTLVTSGLAWFSVSINRAFAAASLIANTQYTFIGLTRSGAHTRRDLKESSRSSRPGGLLDFISLSGCCCVPACVVCDRAAASW